MKRMDSFASSYAEVLRQAEEVFGGREAADNWLNKPALGLEGRRPIDLLSSTEGCELVYTFLVRIEYGVYH
ncbi:putative toxin-antitoxin system antitoxin component [compost metagenome]